VELGSLERAVLDLERDWWQEAASKEVLIRRRVGVSPSRYYRLLQALLEVPEAMAYDPLVVRRLRRTRTARRRERATGTQVSAPPRR
jgi:hypothetical protein